ncbi:MAG TPA: MBL fold metallo-hydrolase [Gemmatimonadaceae bacterium]
MKVWVLGSGSRGNAVVVESAGCRVMIDCGFGPGLLKRRMEAMGIAPQSIEACVITHEHTDHVRGARRAQKKWGWPMFATTGTALSASGSRLSAQDNGLSASGSGLSASGSGLSANSAPNITQFRAGATLAFSDMDVETFRTSHDAMEPIGVTLTSRTTGARAAIVTDLGVATDSVRRMISDVDLMVIESNHDEEMLLNGPYPMWLQRRILSKVGHLSNAECADLVSEAVTSRLRTVVLAHLSEENNTPRVAFDAMKDKIRKTRFRGLVGPAMQDAAVGPFTCAGGSHATQLALGL